MKNLGKALVALLSSALLWLSGTAVALAASDGSQNALTDEQYAQFGLTLPSAASYQADADPLSVYEPLVRSELYLGTMNDSNQGHYEGYFRVMDDTKTLSADALNINQLSKRLVGSQTSIDNHDKGFQTQNTCAVDIDGDGTDEIAELTLYTSNKTDYAQLSVYDLQGNSWKETKLTTWTLTGKDASYIQSIDANTSKGYVGLAAGDYDRDGSDEIACYVACRTSGGAFVAVFDPAAKTQQTISLSSIASRFDVTSSSWTLDGAYMPVVHLATTAISGGDDLVINVGNPLKDGPDQRSALAIYSLASGSPSRVYFDDGLTTQSGYRMRFCSATDADLLGHSVPVLVEGGFRNEDFSSSTKKGKLTSSANIIQLLAYDTGKGGYCRLLTQEDVPSIGSKISLSTSMMEPAAIAAGQLHSTSAAQQVFLEGAVVKFISTDTPDTPAIDRLRDGKFMLEHKIAMKGDNSPFISQAAIGVFSTGGNGASQLVVLQGDENTFNGMNDKIYYDICWAWESLGVLTSQVTDNDLVESDQDDNGTYASICALNVDDDTLKIEYQGCEYGWTEPKLYAVLQSPPYWRELLYESPGSVSFEISSGIGDGKEDDFNLGGGIFLDGTVAFGAGFLGTDGRIGGTGSLDITAQYAHTSANEHSEESTCTVTVSPGQDHVVVFACPEVVYNYHVWMPEHEMGEDEYKIYDANRKPEDPVYHVGSTIPASWQDAKVVEVGTAAISHLTVTDYNRLVDELGDATHLPKITADLLPGNTIGDPSTYPTNTDELKAVGNIDDLYTSPNAASVQAGDGETELAYSISDEHSSSKGWHLDGGVNLGVNVEGTASFFFSAKVEVDAGVQVIGDGGQAWMSSSMNGTSFSTVFADLPEGTNNNAYGFSSNMAVWTMDLGDKDTDDPFVIGYLAQTVADQALPPALPSQLRVFGTTQDKVLLRWEKSDYRTAGSWEIFVKDNNGFVHSLGVVDKPLFLAENLDAGKTYQFALKAYTGANGTGVASSMSAWVSATTKEQSDTVPHFVEYPTYAVVVAGSSDEQKLHAKAEMGEGMAERGATLTYQWQRFSSDSLELEGSWDDIDGATGEDLVLPTLTETDGGFVGSDGETYNKMTYYRVVAIQRLGANVHSTISNTCAMIAASAKEFNENGGVFVLMSGAENGSPLALGVNESPDEALRAGQVCFYLADSCDELELIATLADENAAAAKLLLVQRDEDGERVVAEAYADNQGKTPFLVPTKSLSQGCELAVVFEGLLADDGSWASLPCRSKGLFMYGVNMRKVAYDAGSGTNTALNPGMITSYSDVTTLQPSLRRGYRFVGWQDAKGEPVTKLGASDSTPNETLQLTAVYEAESYPISYELGGGTNDEANPAAHTIDDSVKLKPATKEGGVFAGWFLDAEHAKAAEGVPLNSVGPITFYAAWEGETPSTPVEPGLKEGWNDPKGDGTSWCFVRDGEVVANEWIWDNGWYLLGSDGAMVSGWTCPKADGTWFYLSEGNYGSKGRMVTGWIFDGGWYYLNEAAGKYAAQTGEMVRSKTVPGGTVGADGRWIG